MKVKNIYLFIILFIFVGIILYGSIEVSALNNDKSDRIIVSLGDSYSSGEGIDPFFDSELPLKEKVKSQDWLCHRSKNAWSGMLKLKDKNGNSIIMNENRGSADKVGNWYFVAMSGAVIDNILDTEPIPKDAKVVQTNFIPPKVSIKSEYAYRFKEYNKINGISALDILHGFVEIEPQLNVFDILEKQNKKADYVTMTIGGNDAKFTDVVKNAALGCRFLNQYHYNKLLKNIIEATEEKNSENETKIQIKLEQVFRKIKDKAGEQAHIIVVGYPILFYPEHIGKVFSPDEISLIDKAAVKFNSQIEETVKKCRVDGIKIHYVSVTSGFEGKEAYSGKGLLSGRGAYIHSILPKLEQDIDDMSPISAYSMHPNIGGAKVYAKCVQNKIDTLEETLIFSGIVDDKNTNPLVGVKVTLYDDYNHAIGETETNEKGQYSFNTYNDDKCTYTLIFEKENYKMVSVDNISSKNGLNINRDVTMESMVNYEEKNNYNTNYNNNIHVKDDGMERYIEYCRIIEKLIEQYGKPCIKNTLYGGTAIIKLIDFDGDGKEELYCAYSENKSWVDMQEIYSYKDGKILSVFKGQINNMGTSVEPFVEFYQDDKKCYILSDDQWIEISDDSYFTANIPFVDTNRCTYINIGTYTKTNVIGDTETILKKLNCQCSGIIDIEKYKKQLEIYDQYLTLNDWRTYKSLDTVITNNNLDVIRKMYFDYDGDGNLEMWFKASNSNSLGWPETRSLFCTIENGVVKTLLSTSECGGELGGDYITLTYNIDKDELYIGKFNHTRGFGSILGGYEGYILSNFSFNKMVEYQSTTYNSQSEKKINGKVVTDEEYNSFTNNYYHLDFENAQHFIYYTPPIQTTEERLKNMKIIS